MLEHKNCIIGYSGVLDEGEEVLVNPNLIENKKYQKNAELRRKKDPYQPYADEVDEIGLVCVIPVFFSFFVRIWSVAFFI